MNAQQAQLLKTEQDRYAGFQSMGLKLDMTRGKPCKEQLDLSMGVLDALNSASQLIVNKTDYRNYGILTGIPEIKALFGELTGAAPEELIVAGNSSLNLMYDSLQRAYQFGVCGGVPFHKLDKIKWLCPVPGYDRHFGVTEVLGAEMINVPMTSEGPDIAVIEELVKDPAVKGMWCVPKYSNPQGIVYSDKVVKALAALKPAAADFRIYWDNAYMVHAITEEGDTLLNILAEAKKAGNPDIVYIFGSTSKISFAGAGVAFMAASKKNIDSLAGKMNFQTIGSDKLTQYAHALFFKDAANIMEHMKKHRLILAPKFDTVIKILNEELKGLAQWDIPRGGYFMSIDLPEGTAQRTVALAKDAGVAFTPAGSTYPYKKDPRDANLRIAPSLPPIAELETAMRVFCCCAKIAWLEKQ